MLCAKHGWELVAHACALIWGWKLHQVFLAVECLTVIWDTLLLLLCSTGPAQMLISSEPAAVQPGQLVCVDATRTPGHLQALHKCCAQLSCML